MSQRFRVLALLLATVVPQCCLASGQTPSTALAFVLARAMKCQDDQPTLSAQLERATNGWIQRNRAIANATMSIPGFLPAVHDLKSEMNKEGTFDPETCEQLVAWLRNESNDLDKLFK